MRWFLFALALLVGASPAIAQRSLLLGAGGALTAGGAPALTISCAGTGSTSSTIACTLTYTGTAPVSATGTWNTTCSGSSTITSFTASVGTGSFTASTPASGCAGTLTITTNIPTSATSLSVTISGGSYTGPGDIVSGATVWCGLRAYNAAAAATGTQKAINVRRASDNTTTDILILTSGDLDVASLTSFLTATTGFVTKCYDQSGHSNDLLQATNAKQPQVILSCIGSKPCMRFAAASSQFLSTGSFATGPSLASFSAVINRTTVNNPGDPVGSFTGSAGSTIQFTSANSMYLYNGSACCTSTASDGSPHSFNAAANGASSGLNVDGTDTTGNAGSNAASAFFSLGADTGGGQPFTGDIPEGGEWESISFTSGNRSSISSNQHTYWGF